MSRLQALREKRKTLAVQVRQLADKMNAEGYTPTAEDDGNWKAVNTDYNAALSALEREEAVAVMEGREAANPGQKPGVFLPTDPRSRGDGSETAVTDAQRTLALAGWLKAYSPSGMTAEQAAACKATGLNPLSKEISISLFATEDYNRLQRQWRQSHPSQAQDRVADFKATLGTAPGVAGGYLIAPEQLRTSLEVNMLAFGGMRQVAETIRTASGEPMSWPTADDTTNTGAQLGESTTIGSSVDPTFGKVYWSAYKFSSKPILVPYELLQDSVFNLPAVIGAMLGERLGRITNTKFTTGTGAATCKGIVTAASSFSAASATAIAGDDILGLQHSVDPAYRGGAGFMMHDAIVLVIRKLKDGNGQYLWQPGLQNGVADRLAGATMTINQDMDSTIASGKKTILWGRFSNYKIRTVGDVRMYRLEERYRDTDQDAFIAFTREDGNLLTAGTAVVKYLSH